MIIIINTLNDLKKVINVTFLEFSLNLPCNSDKLFQKITDFEKTFLLTFFSFLKSSKYEKYLEPGLTYKDRLGTV